LNTKTGDLFFYNPGDSKDKDFLKASKSKQLGLDSQTTSGIKLLRVLREILFPMKGTEINFHFPK
jgi:hypothetical protein